MRRRPTVLLLLALALVLVPAVAAGCGGGEETTPTPDDVQGSVPAATGTETGGAETTPAATGGTETGGGGGEGDAAAGKQVFASAGCAACHTLADAGASGSVGPNLDEAKPAFDLVHERVTNGAGAMPAFKDQLSEQQINDVAAYVSSVAGS
jgi:mono/diheme cytochrome c family protein